jgi:predicted lipid-binding transport protein (Tim44 family)
MADSQVLAIILIATVAGIILFRLYAVLGRRTGHERPPPENLGYSNSAGEEAVALPENRARLRALAGERPSDPVAAGLLDIQLADRGFDKDKFLNGARAAYEMIVTAFAAGDRVALRPLLNDEVYGAFEATIKEREAHGEKVAFTFVGFKEVKIVQADLKGRIAEITLAFAAQFVSATSDAQGASALRDVTDVWTFSRDVRSGDPNWTLIATSGELA